MTGNSQEKRDSLGSPPHKMNPPSEKPTREGRYSPRDVAVHYDDNAEGYLAIYGDTLQAFRTPEIADLHRRAIAQADLRDGQTILDSGCGYAGPSLYFAQALDVNIDALTISPAQFKIATEKIREANLQAKITLRLGDYHQLSELYPKERFDRILFLECLGHSRRLVDVLRGAYHTLKPKGLVYVKDFVTKIGETPEQQKRIDEIVEQVNRVYRCNVLDYDHFLQTAEDVGFALESAHKIDFESDIGAWARFEADNAIDLFEGKEPMDFCNWHDFKFRKP